MYLLLINFPIIYTPEMLYIVIFLSPIASRLEVMFGMEAKLHAFYISEKDGNNWSVS
jgi:hypothetical protein